MSWNHQPLKTLMARPSERIHIELRTLDHTKVFLDLSDYNTIRDIGSQLRKTHYPTLLKVICSKLSEVREIFTIGVDHDSKTVAKIEQTFISDKTEGRLYATIVPWDLSTIVADTRPCLHGTEEFGTNTPEEYFLSAYEGRFHIHKTGKGGSVSYISGPKEWVVKLWFSKGALKDADESLTITLTEDQIRDIPGGHPSYHIDVQAYYRSLSPELFETHNVWVFRARELEYRNNIFDRHDGWSPRGNFDRISSVPSNITPSYEHEDIEDSWRRERAMQAGMEHGIRAYNEVMGDD